MFKWLTKQLNDPINLRSWCLTNLYRMDAGLFEIEEEYRKKRILPKLKIDRGYNQLQGKLTLILALMSDFKIGIPADTLSTRLRKRMAVRKGKLTPM